MANLPRRSQATIIRLSMQLEPSYECIQVRRFGPAVNSCEVHERRGQNGSKLGSAQLGGVESHGERLEPQRRRHSIY